MKETEIGFIVFDYNQINNMNCRKAIENLKAKQIFNPSIFPKKSLLKLNWAV